MLLRELAIGFEVSTPAVRYSGEGWEDIARENEYRLIEYFFTFLPESLFPLPLSPFPCNSPHSNSILNVGWSQQGQPKTSYPFPLCYKHPSWSLFKSQLNTFLFSSCKRLHLEINRLHYRKNLLKIRCFRLKTQEAFARQPNR